MLKLSGGTLVSSLKTDVRDLYIDNGKCSFEVSSDAGCEILDCRNLFILPGFVDQHIHGAIRVDFSNCDIEQMFELSLLLASHGVTSFVPTLTTLKHSDTINSLKLIARGAHLMPGAKIIGIHMEGPYLNPEYAGAQDISAMRQASIPEMKEYIKAAEGYLCLITLAPELLPKNNFLEFLQGEHIKVNIGHSGSTFIQAKEAFKRGAGCVTHFLNGMRAFHQHEPSIMGASILGNNYVEIICDGHHLAPETVSIVDRLFGVDRVILVSDSIPAAGLEDGEYHFDCFAENVVIINGDAQLKFNKSRAGSTLFMDKAFQNYINFTGRNLSESIKCSSLNSLKYLGLDDKKGELEEGKDADIVVLDDKFNVVYTIVEGKIVFNKNNHNHFT